MIDYRRLPNLQPSFDAAVQDFIATAESDHLESLVRRSRRSAEEYPISAASTGTNVRIWLYNNRSDDGARQRLTARVWEVRRARSRLGLRLSKLDAILASTNVRYADLRGRSIGDVVVELEKRAQLQGKVALVVPREKARFGGPCRTDLVDIRVGNPPRIAQDDDRASLAHILDGRWRHLDDGTVEASCPRSRLKAPVETRTLPMASDAGLRLEVREVRDARATSPFTKCFQVSWAEPRDQLSIVRARSIVETAVATGEALEFEGFSWSKYPARDVWYVEGYACQGPPMETGAAPPSVRGFVDHQAYRASATGMPIGQPPPNWIADSLARVEVLHGVPSASPSSMEARRSRDGTWLLAIYVTRPGATAGLGLGWPYVVDVDGHIRPPMKGG